MNRFAVAVMMLVALLARPVAAEEEAPVAAPETAPEAGPAATPEPPAKARTGDSLVIVEIHLARRDDRKRSPEEMSRLMPDEQMRERMRKLGTPIEVPGVVVGEGEVLVADPHLEPEDRGEVFAVTWRGERIPLSPGGVLARAPGVLFTGDPARLPPPVRFAEPDEIGAGTPLTGLWLDRVFETIALNRSPASLTGELPDGGLLMASPWPGGALLVDGKGRPVGVSLGGWLWRGGAGDGSFVGLELLRMPGVPEADLEAAYAAVRSRLGRATIRVRLEYRLPGKDDGGGFRPFSGREDLADDEGYGLLLPGGQVLVPMDPGYRKIRQLSRVVAVFGEGADLVEVEGEWGGSFAGFDGLVLRFANLPPETAPAELAPADGLARYQLFFAATPERKFGKDAVKVVPARWLGDESSIEKGRTVRRPAFDVDVPVGTFLADAEGRVVGLATFEKDPEAVESATPSWYGGRLDMPVARVFRAGEIATALSDSEGSFDPRAEPRSRLEAKRGVWLGVEFQYLTPEIARELGIQKGTRDGERGVLVNFVYPGSPAERAGLRVDDVLLYFLEEGKDEATDRKELLRPAYLQWRSSFGGGVRFPSRSNELTNLLTGIGEGRTVLLALLRGGLVETRRLTLEQAPPDFESAAKANDDRLGLTVRDLTYEVRAFYRLPDDAPGVIVSRVESGSAAEVAELSVFDVVQRVEGRPVANVAEFAAAVEAARAAGRPGLTFFVKRLTGTRFLELKSIRENGEEEAAKPAGEEEKR